MSLRALAALVACLILLGAPAWASSHTEAPDIAPDPPPDLILLDLLGAARAASTSLQGSGGTTSPAEARLIRRVQRVHSRIIASEGRMSKQEVDEVMSEIEIIDDQLADPGKAGFDTSPVASRACKNECRAPSARTPDGQRAARVFCRTGCLLRSP